MAYETWLGRATLGRIDGNEYDDMKLSNDLTAIWTYVLVNAGYQPREVISEYYWNEGYPVSLIRQKAKYEREIEVDLDEYFFCGTEDRLHLQKLEDTALTGGIASAIEAYLDHEVPLDDIIA